MTYAKSLKPEQLALLEPLLPNLTELQPGGFCQAEVTKGSEVYIRYLLYSWLHQQGLKEVFRVRVLQGALFIQRLPRREIGGMTVYRGEEKAEPRELSLSSDSYQQVKELVVENLLECESENAARELLEGLGITNGLLDAVLLEWARVTKREN